MAISGALEIRKGEQVWTSARGEVRLWSAPSGAILVTLVGHGEVEQAKDLERALKATWAKAGRTEVFVDAWRLETYDSNFRVLLTEMFGALPGLEKIHGLLRSRLVRMGAAVANLALGGKVATYGDRASFDAAFARDA